MAVSLLHQYVSAIADSGDTSVVQPSNWNAEHTITMATNKLLGRGTAGTGAVEEITLGTNLSLSGTTLNASGGVTGPGSSTANAIVRWSGTGGAALLNSVVTVADTTGAMALLSDSTSISLGASSDVILARDAANTLALRNSTNAQAFNIYNTYTDASNYERGVIKWSSNAFVVGTENAGTGSSRDMTLQCGGLNLVIGGNLRTTFSAYGHVMYVPFNMQGNELEFAEMTAPAAPSANGVRVYAEDNGSGKTRLMARFATGAAQQIAIEP